ncbi:c-type cytochrome [Bdellovibrio sp. HCB337]|uniref:c-type cytochrome n=1 Tax=Bdellovibrio sp. HCB337 TaxID=3394358 RepID=UPI0039A6E7C0
MKKIFNMRVGLWTLGALVSIIAFNNCGEGFVVGQFTGSSTGGSVLFSRAPGESCEDALLNVYKNTYHPFLSQTCNACHVPGGGGNGNFAVSDAATSYSSFASKGMALINSQSTGNHRPPTTGAHNQARIDEISGFWSAAQTGYTTCLSEAGGGGGAPAGSFVVKSTGKAVAANLATTFVRMEWDLETQSNGKVPLVAGIEIRRAVVANVTQGYEFRNPTLRLKNAAAGSYSARALNVYINDQLQSNITTYSTIDTTITATTDVNLAAGFANALAVVTPATTDTIILEYQSLKSTSGAPNPGGTPAPTPTPAATPTATPTPTPIGAVTYASLVANGGIFANSCNSCHRAGNAAGGLDLTNYTAARNAAQNIKTRVNNANNPMPTGGLLPQAQRDRISAWVDQGAPQ